MIPQQAVNIGHAPDEAHFPRVYEALLGRLSTHDRHGQLVFVGAGLPGKVYCEAIREAGGMAVDIGSLMDVWVGKSVRPYQTEEFIAQRRLRGGP